MTMTNSVAVRQPGRVRHLPLIPDPVAFLAPFVHAGVFQAAEVHLAATVAELAPATPEEILLALAVAARGPRVGHVCVVLADVAESTAELGVGGGDLEADLPWPDPEAWAAALDAAAGANQPHAVVATPATADLLPLRPLIWDGSRLYLQRYFTHEIAVAEALLARAASGPPTGALMLDPQEQAVQVALGSRLAVIAGGPGTGKTHTVAKLIEAVLDRAATTPIGSGPADPPPTVALAAPTGKAAARMTEAIAAVLTDRAAEAPPATTIHRMLGAIPGVGFSRNARDPVPADLVVVDETSMVDLSLMHALLDAVRPDATLVLVGDHHQLASVEAGTVLGDIVAAAKSSGSPLVPHLVELTRVVRFKEHSGIAELADAVRLGDLGAAMAVLADDRPDTTWVDPTAPDGAGRLAALTEQLAATGVQQVRAARTGDGAEALRHAAAAKLLAATRRGELGLYSWTERIEAAVAAAVEADVHASAAAGAPQTLRRGERWFVGKPVLVTANDPILGVANGDVGVVVAQSPDDTGADRAVALPAAGDGAPRLLPTARLENTEPWWAMTIHKSQGSEFADAVVSLPEAPSPILTRELLYTAVTRAKERVTIVASAASIAAAVHTPIGRASGLADRLR